MIQIVNIHFEAPRTDAFNKRRTDWVAFLGDQLKRTSYAEVLIDVHQSRTEVTPFDGFYVVSNDRATWKTLRPKPDERHSLAVVRLHAKTEHRLMHLLDGSVHRPARKRNRLPIGKPKLLEVSAHGDT